MLLLRLRGRFCNKKWRRFSWRNRQTAWIGSLMTQFCTIILSTSAFIILSVSWKISFPKNTSTSSCKSMPQERTISLFHWPQPKTTLIKLFDTIVPTLQFFLPARLKILPYLPKLKSSHSWSYISPNVNNSTISLSSCWAEEHLAWDKCIFMRSKEWWKKYLEGILS